MSRPRGAVVKYKGGWGDKEYVALHVYLPEGVTSQGRDYVTLQMPAAHYQSLPEDFSIEWLLNSLVKP